MRNLSKFCFQPEGICLFLSVKGLRKDLNSQKEVFRRPWKNSDKFLIDRGPLEISNKTRTCKNSDIYKSPVKVLNSVEILSAIFLQKDCKKTSVHRSGLPNVPGQQNICLSYYFYRRYFIYPQNLGHLSIESRPYIHRRPYRDPLSIGDLSRSSIHKRTIQVFDTQKMIEKTYLALPAIEDLSRCSLLYIYGYAFNTQNICLGLLSRSSSQKRLVQDIQPQKTCLGLLSTENTSGSSVNRIQVFVFYTFFIHRKHLQKTSIHLRQVFEGLLHTENFFHKKILGGK